MGIIDALAASSRRYDDCRNRADAECGPKHSGAVGGQEASDVDWWEKLAFSGRLQHVTSYDENWQALRGLRELCVQRFGEVRTLLQYRDDPPAEIPS
jgi:hypothetical protein